MTAIQTTKHPEYMRDVYAFLRKYATVPIDKAMQLAEQSISENAFQMQVVGLENREDYRRVLIEAEYRKRVSGQTYTAKEAKEAMPQTGNVHNKSVILPYRPKQIER